MRLALRDVDWDGWNHMDGWGWGWMWLLSTLFVVGVVAVVVALVVALTRGASGRATAPPPAHRSAALDILDQRYARGELTTEEYRERLHVLGDAGARGRRP